MGNRSIAPDEDDVPRLEDGERLDQETFHRRYLKMPEWFRAELIGGIVSIPEARTTIRHGRGHATIGGWLYRYSTATPGTAGQNRATTILGDQSEVHPDSALLILPEYGGQTRGGEDDYTYGAPELVVEVAFSSRSIDLNEKLTEYERAGVLEYIVHDLRNKAVRWHVLRDGRFELLAPDDDDLLRSRAFPGLWLDPAALASGDKVALIAALNRGLASPDHDAFVAELERRRADRAGHRP